MVLEAKLEVEESYALMSSHKFNGLVLTIDNASYPPHCKDRKGLYVNPRNFLGEDAPSSFIAPLKQKQERK